MMARFLLLAAMSVVAARHHMRLTIDDEMPFDTGMMYGERRSFHTRSHRPQSAEDTTSRRVMVITASTLAVVGLAAYLWCESRKLSRKMELCDGKSRVDVENSAQRCESDASAHSTDRIRLSPATFTLVFVILLLVCSVVSFPARLSVLRHVSGEITTAPGLVVAVLVSGKSDLGALQDFAPNTQLLFSVDGTNSDKEDDIVKLLDPFFTELPDNVVSATQVEYVPPLFGLPFMLSYISHRFDDYRKSSHMQRMLSFAFDRIHGDSVAVLHATPRATQTTLARARDILLTSERVIAVKLDNAPRDAVTVTGTGFMGQNPREWVTSKIQWPYIRHHWTKFNWVQGVDRAVCTDGKRIVTLGAPQPPDTSHVPEKTALRASDHDHAPKITRFDSDVVEEHCKLLK